jgi:integrase
MAVFRPAYKDKKTGETKKSELWHYKFWFAGRLIKESAKTRSKTVAKDAERKRRRELEEGFNGIERSRGDRVRTIQGLADSFLEEYRVRHPKSATFAEYALSHVKRLLGTLMPVDVSDKTVVKYQTDRLKENAAPKTINEEVGFFLRLLPLAHAGALRAQLKQQKSLKLKLTAQIGKAYSEQEKAQLLDAAKSAPRSKGIFLATMLAQHAGLRDKEIRTLQWDRFDLVNRVITVGESKTEAGTGRRIPISEELSAAAADYVRWYEERFGTARPEWYVFPFGRPRPNDPTRPQTTLKRAWRNLRSRAEVEGRFHDNRHTFVTDLAETGAGDEVIRDMAGHVSKQMLKHYSHIRMEAKRKAIAAIGRGKPQPVQTSRQVVQDSVQVRPSE